MPTAAPGMLARGYNTGDDALVLTEPAPGSTDFVPVPAAGRRLPIGNVGGPLWAWPTLARRRLLPTSYRPSDAASTDAIVYQPDAPYGSPGRALRGPKTAVVIVQGGSSLDPDTSDPNLSYSAALAAGFADAYQPLKDLGVSVYFLSLNPSGTVPLFTPLLGPVAISGYAAELVGGGSDGFPSAYKVSAAAVDSRSLAAGDVYWAVVGSESPNPPTVVNAGPEAVAAYLYYASYSSADPAVTPPSGMVEIGSRSTDQGGGISLIEKTWAFPAQIEADAAALAACLPAFRSFAFRFFAYDLPSAASSERSRPGELEDVVALVPSSIPVSSAILSPSGGAAELAADMLEFFSP